MTRSDLLAVVYHFYPRGLREGADDYWTSVELHHQMEAARRAVAGYPTWRAMMRRLGARYPFWDRSVGMLGPSYLEDGSYNPAYSGDVDIPGYTLGFHVSVLGPYYGIHRTGAPGEEPAALDVAREIEAAYPGYEPIPPELGDEVVPDVVSLGATTIHECLLSELWPWSSGPRDDDHPPLPDVFEEPPCPAPDGGSARHPGRRIHGRVR